VARDESSAAGVALARDVPRAATKPRSAEPRGAVAAPPSRLAAGSGVEPPRQPLAAGARA
jgi:hypothetical protein